MKSATFGFNQNLKYKERFAVYALIRDESKMLFYECRFSSKVYQKGEHEFEWYDPRDDVDSFFHESHRWAIRRFLAI